MKKKGQRDFECCGFSKVTTSGQMQIPADARKALALDAGTRLMVFADRTTRELVVTIKPVDDDLLDLARRTAADER